MRTKVVVSGALERAKSAAAENAPVRGGGRQPWMTAFGKLKSLRKESARIDRIVNDAFEQIEPEDRK